MFECVFGMLRIQLLGFNLFCWRAASCRAASRTDFEGDKGSCLIKVENTLICLRAPNEFYRAWTSTDQTRAEMSCSGACTASMSCLSKISGRHDGALWQGFAEH